MQASQAQAHWTLSYIRKWTLLCALVHSHVGRGRGHLQAVPTSWERGTVHMSWSAEAARVPFTGTKVPSQPLKNNPHQHLPSTKPYSATGLLAAAKSIPVCQIGRWRSAIGHCREHVSSALQSSSGVLCITLGDVWLGCGCSALDPHPMKLSAHCS